MKNCIIKRAKETNTSKILWEALYYNGVKQVEDYKLDIKKCVDIFANGSKYEIIDIYDSDIDYNVDDCFPEEEDFSYLLDYSIIEPMMFVYLKDGEYIVDKIWDDYREAGVYKIWEWNITMDGKFEPIETEYYFEGHNIKNFTVIGRDETFIWEDYNYQQSYLYSFLNDKP